MDSEKYVVSLNNSGITNRIKNILSVLRLSKRLSRTPVIYWLNNSLTQCEFSDLFENNIKLISCESELKKIFKDKNWREYRDINTRAIKTKQEYLLLNTWRLLTFPNEVPEDFARLLPSTRGCDVDFEFHRTPEKIQTEYTNLIRSLIPVDYINEQVENFSKKFQTNTVSVTVRSWSEVKKRSAFFNIEDFFHVMDKIDDASFFISCDTQEIIDKFSKRYKDRLIYYPKRTFAGDRASKNGMQDILIDLYLLSKNKKIITSFFSTFSEMAWWFGSCRAEIELIGVDDKIKQAVLKRDRKMRNSILLKNLFYQKFLKLKALIKSL